MQARRIMRPIAHSTFVSLLLSAALSFAQTQQQQAAPSDSGAAPAQTHVSTSSDKRRAAKLYLSAAKLYEAGQFEPALREYQQAADLDPGNRDYPLAVTVTRSHTVTALIQASAKARILGDKAGARAALERALAIDPGNANVAAHLDQLALDFIAAPPASHSTRAGYTLSGPQQLAPDAGTHSFHSRGSKRQLIEQVYKAYGISAFVDDSVTGADVRIDLDDVNFQDAANALSLLTGSFAVIIDPHRVLVARDTPQLHREFDHNATENISLLGLSENEMNEVQSISKNVFNIQHSNLDTHGSVLSVEAPASSLNAFNATWRDLSEGRPEVLLDVKVIELAHTSTRNTGVQPPQSITAFNVYAQEQSILNSNQSLVQQIISSGLASPGDTIAILAILLASGQVSSSIFSNGIVLFGNGLTLSGLSPGPATFNLNLNTSDSRELDDYQIRLQDGEQGTLQSGTRYPITTSSYSSLTPNSSAIAGLTSAGNSSSLTSLLSNLSSATNIPMVQYQDLGLTLKATPRVLRAGDVALSIDMKIASLEGESINSVPILANRAYSGMITVPAEAAVVVAGEMDESEINAVSGTPGLSEIPGLNNITDKNTQKNTATLLIIMTPHIVRSPHGLGHSPIQMVDRSTRAN